MATILINNNSDLLEPYVGIVGDKYNLSAVSGQTMRTSYQFIQDFFNNFSDAANADLTWSANNNWLSLNQYSATVIEFESYDYAFRYEGSFSSTYSSATKFEIYQKSTATLTQQFGNMVWQGDPLFVAADLSESTWTGNALVSGSGEVIGISGSGTYDINGHVRGTVYEINTVIPITSTSSYNDITRGQITIAGGTITGGTITDLHLGVFENINPSTYKDSITMSNLQVSIDIAPSAFVANAGNDDIYLIGTASAEAFGGTGDDTITSGSASDRLSGGAGNDTLFGGGGLADTAVFSGVFANYSFKQDIDGYLVITDLRGIDGVDRIYEIELLEFFDRTIYTTDIDTISPYLLSSTPGAGTTNVSIDSNFVITLSESVFFGDSNKYIRVKTDDGSVVWQAAAGDAQFTLSGNTLTVNPSIDLAYGTHYTVYADAGFFVDAAGNPSEQLTNTSPNAYSFTTTTAYNLTSGGSLEISEDQFKFGIAPFYIDSEVDGLLNAGYFGPNVSAESYTGGSYTWLYSPGFNVLTAAANLDGALPSEYGLGASGLFVVNYPETSILGKAVSANWAPDDTIAASGGLRGVNLFGVNHELVANTSGGTVYDISAGIQLTGNSVYTPIQNLSTAAKYPAYRFFENIDSGQIRQLLYELASVGEIHRDSSTDEWQNMRPSSDETIYAGAGDDIIFLTGGNDTVFGGTGYDWLKLRGSANEWEITPHITSTEQRYELKHGQYGIKSIWDVEAIQFYDSENLFDSQILRLSTSNTEDVFLLDELYISINASDASSLSTKIENEILNISEYELVDGVNEVVIGIKDPSTGDLTPIDQFVVLFDFKPRIALSFGSELPSEGDEGTVYYKFDVELEQAIPTAETVGWAVELIDGEASLLDFSGPLSGTVTFAPGETTKQITLGIAGDIEKEGREDFQVKLLNASDGLLIEPVGGVLNAQIKDNDGYDLGGKVYFWGKGDVSKKYLMKDVDVGLYSTTQNTIQEQVDNPIRAFNMKLNSDTGRSTVEIWAHFDGVTEIDFSTGNLPPNSSFTSLLGSSWSVSDSQTQDSYTFHASWTDTSKAQTQKDVLIGKLTCDTPDLGGAYAPNLLSASVSNASGVSHSNTWEVPASVTYENVTNVDSLAGDTSGGFLIESLPDGVHTLMLDKDFDYYTIDPSTGSKFWSAEVKSVNSLDAREALLIGMGKQVSAQAIIAADVNHDGKVNSLDARSILLMSVKNESKLESGMDWVFIDEDADLSGVTRSSVREGIDWQQGNLLLLEDDAAHENLIAILTGDCNGSYRPEDELVLFSS